MKMERPQIAAIKRVEEEADGIKTIFLNSSMKARHGQFIMLWLPRIDEKPFAVSYASKGEIGITVAAVGPFSEKLSLMRAGEKIGVRGPYGRPYTLAKGNLVMIGGGYGSASLAMLAEEAARKMTRVKFILGARSKSRLVYVERIKRLIGEENLTITTDDGSAGRKGLVTDALKEMIAREKIDKIYACGPDKMLKAVASIGHEAGIPGEISMERYMKCGFGLCGHCCVDPIGIRLCVEGPVIDFGTAMQVKELGLYHRLKSSRKEAI